MILRRSSLLLWLAALHHGDAFQPPKPFAKQPTSVLNMVGETPSLDQWRISEDGGISGTISGHPSMDAGDFITTSPLANPEAAYGNSVVETISGSKYYLLQPEGAAGTRPVRPTQVVKSYAPYGQQPLQRGTQQIDAATRAQLTGQGAADSVPSWAFQQPSSTGMGTQQIDQATRESLTSNNYSFTSGTQQVAAGTGTQPIDQATRDILTQRQQQQPPRATQQVTAAKKPPASASSGDNSAVSSCLTSNEFLWDFRIPRFSPNLLSLSPSLCISLLPCAY